MKKDYDKGGLNFFDDWIVISGTSKLEDVTSRACILKIESHSSVVHNVSHSDNLRMGILEEGVNLTFLPPNEMR
jgi:hypothetical protein